MTQCFEQIYLVNLTSYLDSSHMVSQYLLIHSKALKAKTQNRLFYDPSLTHKEGSGGKYDWLSRLFTYGFPIPLNTFSSSRSKNKGDVRGKDEICKFNK